MDATGTSRGGATCAEVVRTFRLDRIGNPTVTTEPITTHAADALPSRTLFEGSEDDLLVTIDRPSAAPLSLRPSHGRWVAHGRWLRPYR
jgi:predicted DNA-binding transcriptional regulator YafY